MNRILTYAVCGLLAAGFPLGAFAYAGEYSQTEEQGDYGVPDNNSASTDTMVMEFETAVEKTRGETDASEIERRQYIPEFMRGYTGRIEGTVTLVGDNVMRMSEAGTRFEYEISINDVQEKALTTGFNIRADLRDGRLVGYTELGVPPDVEKIVYSAEDLPDDNILEQHKAF